MKNKNIVFFSDLCRIDKRDDPYVADAWVVRLYETFVEQICLAVSERPLFVLGHEKNIFDRDKFYKLCGLEPSMESWMRVYSGTITPEAEKYFVSCLAPFFVVSYHGSRWYLDILKKHNIPYIDCFEGGIRFLEDFCFTMRSNVKEIYEKLIKYRRSETSMFIEAARLRSFYTEALLNKIGISPNSLLLCGQIPVDTAVFVNGKFVNFLDFEEKIREIAKNYTRVYYKPHPSRSTNEANDRFIMSLANTEQTNQNTYELLASRQITGVAALSSSILKEAEYFHKTVHVISHNYINYHVNDEERDCDKFVVLKDDYFSPTFWADVLSPCFETQPVEYFNFNNRTNFMRDHLFSRYSYEIGVSPQALRAVRYRIWKLENKKSKLISWIRKIVACFIPSKKWRRKIRGDQEYVTT